MNDPKYRPERLPLRESHERIGRGGQYTIAGPDKEVHDRVEQLKRSYPYNPYQGYVCDKFRDECGLLTVKFRYWSAD